VTLSCLVTNTERALGKGHAPSSKNVHTDVGTVRIDVPRDRNGDFQPRIVPKGSSRLRGFNDRIIALYARGMTVRDIQAHLAEIYGVDVSPDALSAAPQSVPPPPPTSDADTTTDARMIDQPRQPAPGIPPQPLTHGLPSHPIPAGHVRHRGTVVENLLDRCQPLFHQPQLHQHDLALRSPNADAYKQTKQRPRNRATVSTRYRSHRRPATGTASQSRWRHSCAIDVVRARATCRKCRQRPSSACMSSRLGIQPAPRFSASRRPRSTTSPAVARRLE
jgi:hypothetical protein